MVVDLPRPLPLSKISDLTYGRVAPSIKGNTITKICTDSREATANSLFVALSGKNESGEDYINDAISRGAIGLSTCSNEKCIVVDDTLIALHRVAAGVLSDKNIPLRVAVTGSVGKTTTKNILSHLLSGATQVYSSPGNHNNLIGMPMALLEAPYGTETIICEMGMNSPGEISAMSKLLRPTHGAITNIGHAHIGMLGSREAIALAKLEIMDGMSGGPVFIPYSEPLLKKLHVGATVSVGQKGDYRLIKRDDSFSFIHPLGVINDLRPPCEDISELECLTFALAIASSLGIESDELKTRVCSIPKSCFRRHVIELDNFTIIDDTYNASPESMTAGLEFLRKYNGRPIILCLGDMLELGNQAPKLHTEMGRLAKKLHPYAVYLKGDYAPYYNEGLGGNATVIADGISYEDVGREILSSLPNDAVIYLKASNAVGFGKLTLVLERSKKEDERS